MKTISQLFIITLISAVLIFTLVFLLNTFILHPIVLLDDVREAKQKHGIIFNVGKYCFLRYHSEYSILQEYKWHDAYFMLPGYLWQFIVKSSDQHQSRSATRFDKLEAKYIKTD